LHSAYGSSNVFCCINGIAKLGIRRNPPPVLRGTWIAYFTILSVSIQSLANGFWYFNPPLKRFAWQFRITHGSSPVVMEADNTDASHLRKALFFNNLYPVSTDYSDCIIKVGNNAFLMWVDISIRCF